MKNNEQAPFPSNLLDEDVVRRILESGSPEEIDRLRAMGMDQETFDLYRHFAQLRKVTIEAQLREVAERTEQSPMASDEELSAGTYCEWIEPQARDAVFRLRRKGYGTVNSGFGIENRQTITFDAPYFTETAISDSLRAELTKEGVVIELKPSSISMFFNHPASLLEMKRAWNRIEEALPDLGTPAPPATSGLAIAFRETQSDPEFMRRIAEDMETKGYEEYLNDLGLTEGMLKNKRIVDIGAGTRMFAGHCVRMDITNDVFSVEPNNGTTYPNEERAMGSLWSKEEREKIDGHTIRGTRESLPFQNETMDLMLVHGAMPGTEASFEQETEKMQMEIDHTFAEIIRVLKSGGEARLFPFYTKEYHPYRTPWKEAIDQALDRLSKNSRCSIRIEPVHETYIEGISLPTEMTARIVISKK